MEKRTGEGLPFDLVLFFMYLEKRIYYPAGHKKQLSHAIDTPGLPAPVTLRHRVAKLTGIIMKKYHYEY